jgi:hypothetical protein
MMDERDERAASSPADGGTSARPRGPGDRGARPRCMCDRLNLCPTLPADIVRRRSLAASRIGPEPPRRPE